MQSMIPMLSEFSPMSFAIAPHFVWVLLAALVVSGVAVVVAALRAENRRRSDSVHERVTPRQPRPIVRHAERPIAA